MTKTGFSKQREQSKATETESDMDLTKIRQADLAKKLQRAEANFLADIGQKAETC